MSQAAALISQAVTKGFGLRPPALPRHRQQHWMLQPARVQHGTAEPPHARMRG